MAAARSLRVCTLHSAHWGSTSGYAVHSTPRRFGTAPACGSVAEAGMSRTARRVVAGGAVRYRSSHTPSA